MRKRISPATIIACVALFFSLGGASLAASHYLITSVRQIAPKVRHELRGAQGSQGSAGPAGPAGPVGPQGPVSGAGAYVLGGDFTVLTPADPATERTTSCRPGDSAIAGSYDGNNIVVTTSRPTNTGNGVTGNSWTIRATLQDGASSGYVLPSVICVPAAQNATTSP